MKLGNFTLSKGPFCDSTYTSREDELKRPPVVEEFRVDVIDDRHIGRLMCVCTCVCVRT